MDALTMKANATNQAIGAIASGVGTVAGSYSARQTQPVINSGVSNSRNGVAYNSRTGQPIPRAQIVG
ncbi:hypothetical protein, partial [Gilvimarinus sp. 1_MG-2023]|uniref:hypothetical protein n=1 Tax=Gilvimarinus sp. 1_MG-2023 TaxID=3062638 RepID=UPI0026E30427